MKHTISQKWREITKTQYNFDKMTKVFIILLIIVFSAVFGFIYETLFYREDLGHFVKRGTTYGPWIPIYGFGGLFIAIIAYHFRKNAVVVFLLSALTSGILEFCTGYYLFHVHNIRLWDYNTEIWNWGNIGGYICFRSVIFFGISGLFLVYLVIPFFHFAANICNKWVFRLMTIVLSALFFFDIIISNIFPRV